MLMNIFEHNSVKTYKFKEAKLNEVKPIVLNQIYAQMRSHSEK